MAATDKLDEDYQKIAHQVSQLRQAARQSGGHSEKPAEKSECIFCKIAKKEIPAKIMEESATFIAFLDIQPKSAGHTIIISKRHFAGIEEMNDVESSTLLDMIKSISKRMKANLRATGYSVVSASGISSGQLVPHFAVHLIPTYTHSVDIPVMNLIQPAKVPEFVMAEVEKLLRRI